MKGEKYCGMCHNMKPISEYTKQRSSRDGRRNICKTCQRKQNAHYRATRKAATAAEKAKTADYLREYRIKNRQILLEKRRERIARERRRRAMYALT